MNLLRLLLLGCAIAASAVAQSPAELLQSGYRKAYDRDHAGAIKDLTKAIETGDASILADAHLFRALARAEFGDRFGALVDFDKAHARRPEHIDTLMFRGETHESGGNTQAALADFAKVTELKPAEPAAWARVG